MGRVTPLLTSRKVLNITYQTPQETLLETPETLPTAEPATPQISYTVAEADLPSLSITLYQKIFIGFVFGAGKCVTAATVSYRMKKNGESVKTGTLSVSANYFYTFKSHFYDIIVGDVLELALWSNQTDSNWDYKAFVVGISRIIVMDKPRLLSNISYDLKYFPILTLGNPSIGTTSDGAIYHEDFACQSISSAEQIATFLYQYPKSTYGLIRAGPGDSTSANSVSTQTSATYRPAYAKAPCPFQIIMRGVRID